MNALGLVIDDGLVAALVPVGFVLLVSLMVWIIRELGRLSVAVTRLATSVENNKEDIDGLSLITTGLTGTVARQSAKVSYIEGRLRQAQNGDG